MSIAFIPEIGTKLVLTSDWTFQVRKERRNGLLAKADGKVKDACVWDAYYWESGECRKGYDRTLPAGTELILDRIYVRKGISAYSSVTLRISSTPDPVIGKKKPRFWVKLNEFNAAQFEVK